MKLLLVFLILINIIVMGAVQTKQEKMVYMIFSEKCFSTFFEQQQFDVNCAKQAVSKILGLTIVGIAPLAKLPQIYNIVKAKSVDGLSFFALFIECLAFTFTWSYNVFYAFPFSTYGEVIFLLIQNLIIMFLFPVFAKQWNKVQFFSCFLLYGGICTYLLSGQVTEDVYKLSIVINIFFALASKTPQILLNHSNKSTGHLSLITTTLFFGGSIARLITIFVDVPDFMLQVLYTISSALNGTIFLQFFVYPKTTQNKLKKH